MPKKKSSKSVEGARTQRPLPLKLPVSSVRRAVESGMGFGYFQALSDLGVFRAEARDGRLYLPDNVRELFLEDASLVLDLEIYKQLMIEKADEIQEFLKTNFVDLMIREAHLPSLNPPGREPLSDMMVSAATRRKRRQRPLKRQPPTKA